MAAQDGFAASVIGVLTESSQASIGGSLALRGQTVLSGDRLLVGNGAAIVLLAPATRVILRRDTEVSFRREQDGAAVAFLARGDLSFSHNGGNPQIQVRTGNVTIRPASRLRTQGIVTVEDGALTIAAASGSVRVEGAGQTMDLPEGKAVQLVADGGTTGGTPAPTASTGLNWGKPVLCGLAGGAVGSIPVIVKEQNVSPDVGGYWAAIPGGIGAGVLLCSIPKPPSPRCTLSVQPSKVSLGDTVTLSWTSPSGYQDVLSDVGPEPSSGTVQVKPSHTGVNRWELTGIGPLGNLVCDARADVKEPPKVCKLWYTTDDAKNFQLHWTLPKDATDAVLEDTTKGGETWKVKGIEGDQEVSPRYGRQYTMRYNINENGKVVERVCHVKVPLPVCVIRSTKVPPPWKGFNLQWWEWGLGEPPLPADTFTMEPKIKPPDKSYTSSASVNPKDETTYTLTVKAVVYKDSSNPGLGTIPSANSCSVTVSPLACTIAVDPDKVDANAKKPPEVTVKWASKDAKKQVLTAFANNKPINYPKNIPPNPQNNPPTPQTREVTGTTQFVLDVTGPDSEKASCRACVLNRPEEGEGNVLDIPPVFQQNAMWCWLTVGEMIFKYNKVPPNDPWKKLKLQPPAIGPDKAYQWGILAIMNPGCWRDPDACAMTGGSSWKNLQDMLEKYPVETAKMKPIGSELVPGCLTKDQIKKEIDAGRPIEVGITPGADPAPAANAHVALIIGYQEKGADFQVVVNDPWPYHVRTDPNFYIDEGGSRNCDANYTLDLKTFCKKAGWNGSLSKIQSLGK
jgi:hypothetical protein